MKSIQKRFTPGQFLGALAALFLGIVTVAYAVTLPFPSFTAGTAISASQVNANFAALDVAVDALEVLTQTRHFSCAGTSFAPRNNIMTHEITGSLHYFNGIMRCNVVIPQGATVTAVRFSVNDTSATQEIGSCAMWRTNMVTTIGTETQMASVAATGVAATPGAVQLSNTTIASAVIDNVNYSYFVQCFSDSTSSAAGLYGANVTYSFQPTSPTAAAVEPAGYQSGSSSDAVGQ